MPDQKNFHHGSLKDFLLQIVIPVALAATIITFQIFYIRREGVSVTIESAPLFYLQFLFTFLFLPVSLIIEMLEYFDLVDLHIGSHAWQIRLFTKALYAVLFIISIFQAVSWVLLST